MKAFAALEGTYGTQLTALEGTHGFGRHSRPLAAKVGRPCSLARLGTGLPWLTRLPRPGHGRRGCGDAADAAANAWPDLP